MRSSLISAAALIGAFAFAAPSFPLSAATAEPTGAPGIAATLTRFRSETEFRRYVRDVRAVARARKLWWAERRHRFDFAQASPPATDRKTDAGQPPVCPPENPNCLPAEPNVPAMGSQSITVTGSRVAPHNSSITNNQTTGVDEGDIVKQSGQFLLVLQDGRIFSIDTRPGGAPGLAVADRVNVYRDPKSDTWYDEMLVLGDRVVITGYSYDEESAELSVFRVGRDGRLTSLGTFFVSSNDYYSVDNYASRLVGDNLVVYSPLAVTEIDPEKPVDWPIVRRWVAGETRDAARRRGRPLLDATSIYRPTVATFHPVVHTISVCPLAEADSKRELQCRSTGFVGPDGQEVYVSPEDAYLWTYGSWYDLEALRSQPDCRRRFEGKALRGAVYRVPLNGDDPGVQGVTGAPVDHFALETDHGNLRALLRNEVMRCDEDDDRTEREAAAPDPRLAFFSTPLEAFDAALVDAPARAYTPMPSPGSLYVANRFTDDYVVYGGMARYGPYPPDADKRPVPARAFAVPVRNPSGVRQLDVPHTIIRAERAGDDIVLTGYRDASGLDLSLVDLRRSPRIAATAHLDGRFETEGRSHAFNSLIESDGSGVMGIPTGKIERDSPRWWWRSGASDVSFIAADRDGKLSPLGELATSVKPKRGPYGIEDQDIPGYDCEVSCIDWYGNSRPIFTDGRVFALTGAELIEGRIEGGAVREVRRLLFAGPTRPRTP
jgi:hypothetical protein